MRASGRLIGCRFCDDQVETKVTLAAGAAGAGRRRTPLKRSFAASRWIAATTFRDPEAINSFSPPAATQGYRAQTDKLRYRVRFRYPVDPLADPGSGLAGPDGKRHVDPSKHYLLDTPVFDDISITYFTKSRILSYREVTE